MEENYSIQAKNLLDNLINEYNEIIKSIHKIDIVLKQVKGIRIEVNKRTRWISEVANISKEVANRKIKILIYNEDYIDPVEIKSINKITDNLIIQSVIIQSAEGGGRYFGPCPLIC